MIRLRRAIAYLALLALAMPFLGALPARSQERLSDKDLEQRIKNMNTDIKKFRSMFNSAIAKSSIRKTTQEKDAKTLVANFQKQGQSLYSVFKQSKKGDPYIQNCLDGAAQIDKLVQATPLDADTTAQWAKIKPQLHAIAAAFHVPGQ